MNALAESHMNTTTNSAAVDGGIRVLTIMDGDADEAYRARETAFGTEFADRCFRSSEIAQSALKSLIENANKAADCLWASERESDRMVADELIAALARVTGGDR